MSKKKDAKAIVKVDTTAGSRTFNRLDMQLSQTLHMAIELYDDLNFLFVLDHYDDITIFNLDSEPLAVSYYQMKTSENVITIDSAIKENWISKLYSQFNRPEGWLVQELGLITNCPLEITYEVVNNQKARNRIKDKLSADKSQFVSFHTEVQKRIISDIALKCGVEKKDVDLTKLAHMRTTLSISSHRNLIEQELSDMLFCKYPRIKVDTVKGVYSSLIDILTKKQEYEGLSSDASLEDVRKHKGIERTEVKRVIDQAIMVSLPKFEDVFKYSQVEESMKSRLSLPYVTILSDSTNKGDNSFPNLFSIIREFIKESPFDSSETAWDYGQKIGTAVRSKEAVLCIPYPIDYIAVLAICLLINESRRKI